MSRLTLKSLEALAVSKGLRVEIRRERSMVSGSVPQRVGIEIWRGEALIMFFSDHFISRELRGGKTSLQSAFDFVSHLPSFPGIAVGSRVRSFHFPERSREIEGAETAFVEGVVVDFVEMEGCRRYKIQVLRNVMGGKEPPIGTVQFVYPPVNGTPRLFGGVTDGVELVEGA